MKHLGYAEVDIASLLHFPGNPRVHAKGVLQGSVRRFGQFRTLVVRQLDDGRLMLIAGHGTADAMLARGIKTARVEINECTDDEARGMLMVDNHSSDLAHDDPVLQAQVLGSIEDPGLLADLGWSEKQLTMILGREDMPAGGDADTNAVEQRWGVIIECATEADQVVWLERLAGEGANVRAIVS